MARWEPNASQRLASAALELFMERGYENTTVVDIAQRAGLAKSTFFRHFQDKRGVLFGEELMTEQLVTAIAAAPDDATPLEAVARGLGALGESLFTDERRALVTRRRAVIDAHPDLMERETLKIASLTASIARALADRGVAGPVAEAAAQLGALVLKWAYERWTEAGNEDGFGDLVRRAASDVQAAVQEV
ncbi:TetR family transcriptional regulator [Actinospica sp. MGRD01-02]|uniref:TetR family transcriptional regulator n=1 Tax=Actinospica acidithermotolerans TaxID=2828514 RepID=A0A941IK36_9ACTN|nr:TetR/AcrR family transcriptional regulator [Actinospica acidithermotolerans]MBR7828522.1 TetR family transcriptional regulator [Actinospica acidithermotolerans]